MYLYYCSSAVVLLLLCFGVAVFFACGLVFVSGVVYGIMGIGKKYGYK